MSFKEDLREKLPPDQIKLLSCTSQAAYHDWYGVTYRESVDERQIVREYLTNTIEAKVGYKIKITEEQELGNGHFLLTFVPA